MQNANAEMSASSTITSKATRKRRKRGGRGEMFIAIIQMAMASAIVNTGLFIAYSFMKTVQEWVENHSQSEITQYRFAMRNQRITYYCVSLSFGGCIFLIKLAVLLRIFFVKISLWRTIIIDMTIIILTILFAILSGVHSFDVLNYPNDRYHSVDSFVKAIEITTIDLRQEATSALTELHQKVTIIRNQQLKCCGVHSPSEMAQMSKEYFKTAEYGGHFPRTIYEHLNTSHICKLPESCCVHIRPGCNIRSGEKAAPIFFKEGCSRRFAQLLGEHLLLLSLNSAALTVLSFVNIAYVHTHRKQLKTNSEEVAPPFPTSPVAAVPEQIPQVTSPTPSR
uniref:Tetraspanin n=1 Tax=Ascaris lumbricoides TaxID=6252 RepID=A0A9J2PUK6_ASCLU